MYHAKLRAQAQTETQDANDTKKTKEIANIPYCNKHLIFLCSMIYKMDS